MGHRMEIYCDSQHVGSLVQGVSSFKIYVQAIGHTEISNHSKGENHLTIKHLEELLVY